VPSRRLRGVAGGKKLPERDALIMAYNVQQPALAS
jgi:hypothetical protein